MPLATDLRVVSGLAATQLDPLWTIDNPDELSAAVYEVLPPLVDQWSLASSAVAADWYDAEREKADVAGAFRAIVEPIKDLGTEALIAWATEPLRQPEPDLAAVQYRAVGGLQKRLANSANYTITNSSKADPQSRGWIRTTRPQACDFCRMVASRGGVFTEATSRFACHEKCHCASRPIWGGQEVQVEAYKPSARDLSAQERAALNKQARSWIKANLK